MRFGRKHKTKRSKEDKRDDALRDNHDDELIDEVDATDDTSGEPSKLSQTFGSLKPDGHRKIERTMVFFACASTLFITGVGVSAYHIHNAQQSQSETLTAANSTINFSKTAAGFVMGAPQLNTDKDTYYLPVTFNNMSVLSTNSNHYNIFMSATNGTLNYKAKGVLVMYGSSGRGVFVFHSPTGFKNQPVTIYVKNEVDLNVDNSNGNDSVGNISSDAGIAKAQQVYDLAVFKTNLGLPGTTTNSKLKGDEMNTTELYSALFSQADKAKIQKNVDKDKAQIAKQVPLAKNLYNRLTSAGYNVPSVPDWMSNDWRPKDSVDTETGEVGTSGKFATATGDVSNAENYFLNNNKDSGNTLNSNAQTSDSDDNNNTSTSVTGAMEAPNWPSGLKKKDGETFNTSNTGAQGINGQGNSADATVWENLQQTWTNIQLLKRDIYVTQNANFYSINHNLTTIGNNVSIGSNKRFRLIGNVNVQ